MTNTTLPDMKLEELVLGVILLNQGNPDFKESILEKAFKKAIGDDPQYQALFTMDSFKSTNFAKILFFIGKGGGYLETSANVVYTHMTESGKKHIIQGLQNKYGADILDRIRPIAEKIWSYETTNHILSTEP